MAKRKSTKVRLALVIYCVMNDNIIMDSTIAWLMNASIQPSIKCNLLIFGKKNPLCICFYYFLLSSVREYRKGNQKRTIQRNRKHMAEKTKKNRTQNVSDTTTPKQTQARQISKYRTPPHPNKHKQGK